MNRGGVETWLMQVLRRIDRRVVQMDFLVSTDRPCAYDDEILSLGCRIIPCLNHTRPWLYARNFRRALRQHGPYDVVHSHVQHYSGFVLRLAHWAGVPVRIAHSHTNNLLVQAKAGFLRRRYLGLMGSWLRSHATLGLAISRQAAAALYGPNWQRDPRWRLLYYGLDLAPFRITVDPAEMRRELGLPPDTLNIVHTGRFVEVKNHSFMLDVALEVAKREPKFRLLLIGDGPLRPAIEQQASRLGLDGTVLFTGVRTDIQRLLLGAADVFLFPSRFEGFGLALVEAQAAGVPCVCSDCLPPEADVVAPLVRRLSLSQPASAWAEALLALGNRAPCLGRSEALAYVDCDFNIQTSVDELTRIYAAEASCPQGLLAVAGYTN
jgi:glycosyltransferase involved in cell wall biosynthesis